MADYEMEDWEDDELNEDSSAMRSIHYVNEDSPGHREDDWSSMRKSPAGRISPAGSSQNSNVSPEEVCLIIGCNIISRY